MFGDPRETTGLDRNGLFAVHIIPSWSWCCPAYSVRIWEAVMWTASPERLAVALDDSGIGLPTTPW